FTFSAARTAWGIVVCALVVSLLVIMERASVRNFLESKDIPFYVKVARFGSFDRGCQHHAEVRERHFCFLGPRIEDLADADAVLLAFGLAWEGTPVLQRLHDGICKDERVLACHAQEIGTGVAA